MVKIVPMVLVLRHAFADFFKNHGVDVITSGNHIWHKKEIFPYLSSHQDLLRPANFPTGVPGVGVYCCQ